MRLALFLAGFASFSLIYCTQPLLPEFATDFGIDAAQSSLAVSVTTGCLAVSILVASAFSEAVGRRGLMFAAMAVAAICNIAAGFAPGWGWLIAARAVEGVALGGVPAVAMAYLGEEAPPNGLGLTMGLYVSGTAFGGMAGRVGTGALTELLDWREALAIVGVVDLAAAVGFILLLPRSRGFVVRHGLSLQTHLQAWAGHLRDPRLLSLFVTGFLALGGLMLLYNFIGFRLAQPPYNLNPAQLGLIFLAYLGGVAASAASGAVADRLGRPVIVITGGIVAATGFALTLASGLFVIIAGVLAVTVGFFMIHATVSGWVSRSATRDRAHAAALYLLAYYAGGSLIGSGGGWVWHAGGWPAVVAAGAALFGIVSLIGLGWGRHGEQRAAPCALDAETSPPIS